MRVASLKSQKRQGACFWPRTFCFVLLSRSFGFASIWTPLLSLLARFIFGKLSGQLCFAITGALGTARQRLLFGKLTTSPRPSELKLCPFGNTSSVRCSTRLNQLGEKKDLTTNPRFASIFVPGVRFPHWPVFGKSGCHMATTEREER